MKFLAEALIYPQFRTDELDARAPGRDRRIRSERVEPDVPFTHSHGQGALDYGLEPKKPARRTGGHSEHDAGEDARRSRSDTTSRTTRQSSSRGTSPPIARSRSRTAMFGGWQKGADPFTTDPIPPIPPLTHDTAVIVEQDDRERHRDAPVAGSERHGRSGRDVRRRRLFGCLEPIRLPLPAASRRQRVVRVDRRQLLHAQPRRADHDRRRNHRRSNSAKRWPRFATKWAS